jgi:predicted HAD superfamily Cof-like phosphohydrolase
VRNGDREDTVAEFHRAFKHAISVQDSDDLIVLRNKLIQEEYDELKDEMAAAMVDIQTFGQISTKTKARMLKEMADLQYVLSGLAVALGLPLQTAFNRVHKSNMSKLGDDGKPVLRADGKILKGPNYIPPDLEDLVE